MRPIVVLIGALVTGLIAAPAGVVQGDEAPFGQAAPADTEVQQHRAEVTGKLRALTETADAKAAGQAKADPRVTTLKEIFKARLQLLDLHDSTAALLKGAENPEPTPEAEAAALKLSTERSRAAIEKSVADPHSLLPEAFRTPETPTTEKQLAEMMEAVTAAQEAVDALKKALDDPADTPEKKPANPIAQARERREKARQTIAVLQKRIGESEAALANLAADEDRETACERLLNLKWELRVETLRLREADVRFTLETKRAELADARDEATKLDLEISRKRLEAMRQAHRHRVELQRTDLKKASATESARAQHTADPLERFRALRSKELLDEQALLQERELELAATPAVSLSDQTGKAEKAAEDFKRLKALVTGKRSTGLVAQRLNNSYRKLVPERAAIQRNELAMISGQLTRYENELTVVELDQLNETRGHHTLRDELLQALPTDRKAQALAILEDCERKQEEILDRRRRVLSELVDRADQTRQQVLLRLQILDDQYGFVRTHLFWVRDSPPLSRATIDAAQVEAAELTHALVVISAQPWSWAYWQKVTTDFVWASVGLVLSPWVLYRVRRGLRNLLAQERAVSLPPEPSAIQG